MAFHVFFLANWQKQYFGPENVLDRKIFGTEKCFGPKNVLTGKFLGPENVLDRTGNYLYRV